MVDWNELAERCAKATEPSRMLDADIFMTAGGRAWDDALIIARRPCGCPDDMAIREARAMAPPFTESRDSISRLIARALPGWAYKMGTCSVSDDAWLCPDFNDPVHGPRLMQKFGPITQGSVFDYGFDIDRRPSGNMALAMCEAFCRAMAAVAEKDAAREGK